MSIPIFQVELLQLCCMFENVIIKYCGGGVEFINNKTWKKIPSLKTGMFTEKRGTSVAEQGIWLPLQAAPALILINAPFKANTEFPSPSQLIPPAILPLPQGWGFSFLSFSLSLRTCSKDTGRNPRSQRKDFEREDF